MLKNSRHQLLLILSMAIFGTLGPFIRQISVSSGEIALYRAILAALIIGLFMLVSKQRIDFKAIRKEIPLLLISGMAMGINWMLLFEAYKYTTVSIATLSYYFAPVIVIVVCPFLFKERLGPKQIICSLLSTVGLVLIIGVGEPQEGSTDLLGIILGLGAAVFYATVMLLNKFIKNVEGVPRTFIQFIAAIIIMIPYVAFTGGITLGTMDSTGWICLLVVGIVHTGVTYCMYFSALKELPGQKAAILSYIDPLVSVLVSMLILNEGITPMQIIGGILILGFTLWNEVPSRKKSELT